MPETAANSPVTIGGIGGSGTRVVAELVSRMGVFIGDNINKSSDNLSFPNLRELLYLSNAPDAKKEALAKTAIENFALESRRQLSGKPANYRDWGWKVPGTFFWLDILHRQFPDMVYIHVIRHGLDMALSKNRNQLRTWGGFFGIELSDTNEIQAALDYWIKANQFAIECGKRILEKQFLLISFDQLCATPGEEVQRLSRFLGFRLKPAQLTRLAGLIEPPETLGRYKSTEFERIFDQAQIHAVKDLGFAVQH